MKQQVTKRGTVFYFGEDMLTPGLALQMAAGKIAGLIGLNAKERIANSRKIVEAIVANHVIVYGINTGFGPLCTTIISESDTKKLQLNLLKSHSVGVGEAIDPELAKLMMILKVHALAKGYSGIALETLERIIWHINENIIPVVPSQGSVGASGDLAPLAHLFLPLTGHGKVHYKGKIVEMGILLHKLGMAPLELGAKEGLALI